MGAGVGIGFAAHKFAPPFPPLHPSATASASATEPPSASASAAAVASASVAPEASASASAGAVDSSAAAVASGPPPAECFKQLFPEKTFSDEPSLDFVCTEQSPIKGASRVKEVIVKSSKRSTSAAMKEWAGLGFYELAAFTAIQARCCPEPTTFNLPKSPDNCAPLEDALSKIAKASRQGASADEGKAATKAFSDSVQCIVGNKLAKAFGGYEPPTGPEVGIFEKTLERARR